MNSRDQLDSSRKWYEASIAEAYLSYAMTPFENGLIRERLDGGSLNGKDKIEELIKVIKEENPDLESVYLRLDRSK